MVSPALRFPLTNCRSASILLKKKSAGLRCEIFRNCLATKEKTLTTKLLKVISGGQTGVDRGALDAALALQVECGGWCPEGRLAEDGTIPKRYPVMELANAGYAERTARNVADSDGTLIISNGVPLGGTRETVDRCIEMRKPHLIIDCARRSVQETIEVATEFVTNLSFRVAQTTRNLAGGLPLARYKLTCTVDDAAYSPLAQFAWVRPFVACATQDDRHFVRALNQCFP